MKRWFVFALLILSHAVFADQTRKMSVVHLPDTSYFKVVVENDPLLKGTYAGWCADWDLDIEDNFKYNAKFYSTLSENIPGDIVTHPENLDEVNWILNQNFVGKPSPGGFGIYTMGDVQLAIWTLVDDNFDSSSVGPFSQQRVDEIINRAKTEGSGYNPKCSELVGIILQPAHPDTNAPSQNTIILVPRYRFPKCVVPEGDI